MSILDHPAMDVDMHFKKITTGILVDELEQSLVSERRITVMLHLPYLKDYDMPEIIYPVYGCTFFVKQGDKVLCPPTPRGDGSWVTGIVVSLEGNGYDGPVKYVRQIEE